MDFFIRKKSTLPALKMRLIRDGRIDYKAFNDMLETSFVTFSMVNRDTGVYKIANATAQIVQRELLGTEDPEYYFVYKFTERDTNEEGVFYGEFKIHSIGVCDNDLNIGDLKMPTREELYIHILSSYTN